METYGVAIATAVWLGILTSVSPCPLATNIAAISYIGNKLDNNRKVLLTGLLYTIGRTLVYTTLGIIFVAGLLSIPQVSMFLQVYMNKILGPLLILVGMILLELIKINTSGSGMGQKMHNVAEKTGIFGGLFLGAVFALSFCPVSAALFFGSLIPIAANHNSSILIPSIYGIGTALPVILFAFLVAFGTKYISSMYHKLTKAEKWVRKITGVIFILVGIYYTITFIFDVQLY
jgi:cytochrome c-type biogenesis protein